jgi:hypothetical protein
LQIQSPSVSQCVFWDFNSKLVYTNSVQIVCMCDLCLNSVLHTVIFAILYIKLLINSVWKISNFINGCRTSLIFIQFDDCVNGLYHHTECVWRTQNLTNIVKMCEINEPHVFITMRTHWGVGGSNIYIDKNKPSFTLHVTPY